MKMHPSFYIMTTIMPLCFTVCIVLTIFQTKSIKWYRNNTSNDNQLLTKKRELFCLYGQYIIGAMCAIQCFLCHISNYFPEYYCVYGMPSCVIIYAATKSCLYGFFVERSKCVQSTFIKLLPPFVWTYIFPAYIAIYFLTYLILCSVTFRGEVTDPHTNTSVPTACLFGKFTPTVFALSAFIDILNSICFLFLFMWPILDLMKSKRKLQAAKMQKEISAANNANNNVKIKQKLTKDLQDIIKYNIICSMISCFTSVTFMCIMSFAKHGSIGYYLWLGGNIDIMINSICLFLMPISNRRYIKHMYSKYIKQENVESVRENTDEQTSNDPPANEQTSNTNNESTFAVTSGNAENKSKMTEIIMIEMSDTVNKTSKVAMSVNA
eukprot:272588_1